MAPSNKSPEIPFTETHIDFVTLADNPKFTYSIEANFDYAEINYNQDEAIELVERFLPSEVQELFLNTTNRTVTDGIAVLRSYSGDTSLDFSFNVGGQTYRLLSHGDETKVYFIGSDGNELIYSFSKSLSWRFLLSLAYSKANETRVERAALPEDFSALSYEDKLSAALCILGELTGIYSRNMAKSIVDDPNDVAFIVNYITTEGSDASLSEVFVDMNWMFAGKNTRVNISSSDLVEKGFDSHFESAAERRPTMISHLDYPTYCSLGLADIEPQRMIKISPSENYTDWSNAVTSVMCRLKKIGWA